MRESPSPFIGEGEGRFTEEKKKEKGGGERRSSGLTPIVWGLRRTVDDVRVVRVASRFPVEDIVVVVVELLRTVPSRKTAHRERLVPAVVIVLQHNTAPGVRIARLRVWPVNPGRSVGV